MPEPSIFLVVLMRVARSLPAAAGICGDETADDTFP
jgi:hypothetical protein